MTTDWIAWHRHYDDPDSWLARRLAVVRDRLREAIPRALAATPTPRLLSICAGDGRDVLPVLAELDVDRRVDALLVELDPALTDAARADAAALALPGVRVVTGDAGTTDAYAAVAPADVVLACGVFGNVSPDDVDRTVATLPTLTAPGGTVLWTRGRRADDPTPAIRAAFAEAGFEEVAFVAPGGGVFSVGVQRLPPPAARPFAPGRRMFTFV